VKLAKEALALAPNDESYAERVRGFELAAAGAGTKSSGKK
jgi:hypothetical protein